MARRLDSSCPKLADVSLPEKYMNMAPQVPPGAMGVVLQGDDDQGLVYLVAGQILRKVKSTLRGDKLTQLAQLRVQSATVGDKRKREEDAAIDERGKLPSGSGWTMETMCAAGIAFEPVDAFSKIFGGTICTEDDIRNKPALAEFCSDLVNQECILGRRFEDATKFRTSDARRVLERLRQVIEPDGTTAACDKQEAVTDAFAQSFLQMFGVDDPAATNLVLTPQPGYHIKQDDLEYTARTDFDVQLVKSSASASVTAAVAFSENKRLLMNKRFDESIAQKASEALAVVIRGRDIGKHLAQPFGDLLGICFRQHFISFWRGLFPQSYLDVIGTSNLEEDQFSLLQVYPVSTNGLNLLEQRERMLACQYVLSIVNYLSNQPFPTIG